MRTVNLVPAAMLLAGFAALSNSQGLLAPTPPMGWTVGTPSEPPSPRPRSRPTPTTWPPTSRAMAGNTWWWISSGRSRSRRPTATAPKLVAARANGKLKPGRHIGYAPSTPMTNLFMTLLDTMDVHPESIGDSTGKLEHLADL